MSLQHFFLEDQDFELDLQGSEDGAIALRLSPDDLKHAKVLRLKAGEHIGIIDARGKFFEVEVLETSPNFLVKNTGRAGAEQGNCHVWLAQGLSKGSKFDDIVRACTEIGICGFIPVAFERSISKLDDKKEASKNSRWQKIAKSAAMQSGQLAIPKITEAVDVPTLAEQLSDFDCVLICWEEASSMRDLVNVCQKLKENSEPQNIALVIGPEGGITKAEVELLEKCNKESHTVSISNTILRTETAAAASSAIVKFLLSC